MAEKDFGVLKFDVMCPVTLGMTIVNMLRTCGVISCACWYFNVYGAHLQRLIFRYYFCVVSDSGTEKVPSRDKSSN